MCVYYIYSTDGYVGDQLETWTVLKPSDGFKTGQTALKRAGRL